ncbi:MAG TPA: uracil-DNA glycosylase family protein [Kofleriaceae bacterium]|jgi:uracil-DNA glycosylase
MARRERSLPVLLDAIRACNVCADLPLGPRPIVAASASASILLAGQAPGLKVHDTGIPWNDPSGDTLRAWMGVDRDTFYDPKQVAIVPMGFCYPGKGKSGDRPPRSECAEHWHAELLGQLKNVQLTLVIGSYAQAYHLGDRAKPTLTETVHAFHEYLPRQCVLPHPSPRNRPWLSANPWFERECLPKLRTRIAAVLKRR